MPVGALRPRVRPERPLCIHFPHLGANQQNQQYDDSQQQHSRNPEKRPHFGDVVLFVGIVHGSVLGVGLQTRDEHVPERDLLGAEVLLHAAAVRRQVEVALVAMSELLPKHVVPVAAAGTAASAHAVFWRCRVPGTTRNKFQEPFHGGFLFGLGREVEGALDESGSGRW